MTNSNLALRGRRSPSILKRLPLAAAIYLAMGAMAPAHAEEVSADDGDAHADTTAPAKAGKGTSVQLQTVTVTAQKREENLQKVPISLAVVGAAKLEQMNVDDFREVVKLLPSVSLDVGEGGSSTPYMRGVASGENQNPAGPQPSVGVYFDEQPVTTIGGALDLHMYDIDRVEALAGPQGTLFGASSQAGTLRIITKKPDPSGFSAGYSFELNSVDHGGNGYVSEGFVNVPLSESAAIRVVAWDEYDAGYIDNVHGTRTFSYWDLKSGGNGTIDNAAVAKKDYNDVRTMGARAALKIDLGENWTVTPQVMTQKKETNGNFATDPVVGDLKIQKWYPESSNDKFTQAALTIRGKIGNFDLTYAYTHLKRDLDGEADYSDYSFWYDAYYQSYYEQSAYYDVNYYGDQFVDDNGNAINPTERYLFKYGYAKTSHELRIASPQENRFRAIVGYFWQDQSNQMLDDFKIVGDLQTSLQVTNFDNSLWITNQLRKDHDEAFFGQVSYDFTDKLTATAGMRFYRYENSLKGFFGYALTNVFGGEGGKGEINCQMPWEEFQGSACVNLDDSVKKSDSIGRLNVTYQVDDRKMVYATWSEGFRPGGVNRSGATELSKSPVYQPDILTNYELGWKTSWADNRVVFNGAVFQENWDNMQLSFVPFQNNGITVVGNVGNARIRGLETDLSWAVNYDFTLSGGFSLYDAKLTEDYCPKDDDGNGSCDPALITAPSGTQLPVTAKFKGNLTGRYSFDIGDKEAYVQGAMVYEGKRNPYLEATKNEIYGELAAYSLFDFSAGIRKNSWSLDFYVKNIFDERDQHRRYSACTGPCESGTSYFGDILKPGPYSQGQHYLITGQPRTIGIRFSQEF